MSITQRTLHGKKTSILVAMWLFQRRLAEAITLVIYIRGVLASNFDNDIYYLNQVFKSLRQSFQANARITLPIMHDHFTP
jgi:hypothetical protein